MMTKLAQFAIVNVAVKRGRPDKFAACRASFGQDHAQAAVMPVLARCLFGMVPMPPALARRADAWRDFVAGALGCQLKRACLLIETRFAHWSGR